MTKILEVKNKVLNDVDQEVNTLCKFEKEGEIVNVLVTRWVDFVCVFICNNEEVFDIINDRHFRNKHDETIEGYANKYSFESYNEEIGDWSSKIKKSYYLKEIDYCLYKNEQATNYDEDCNTIEDEELNSVHFDSVIENKEEDFPLQEYQHCRFKPSEVLVSIAYKDSLGEVFDCVTVLNKEKENIQCNGTFYTVSINVIRNIEQCINNSNIFNVKFDGKAYNKLSKLSGIVCLGGIAHYIMVHTTNGYSEFELENVHGYKRYFKYVEPYKAGYIVLENTINELVKAGIEFDELKDSIK